MATFVKGEGPLSARIVLIGEAPGVHEDMAGRPFVGKSGEMLVDWWRAEGRQRRDIRIDNVVPLRPENNDITTVPKKDLEYWTGDLHKRLALLVDPWVLVPTGNTALKALTGKDKVTRWRGSIMQYTDLKGRAIKVIPTIHPAAVFRQPSLERRCRLDWKRIFSDSEFRELRLPEREHVIHPSKKIINEFFATCASEAEYISCDIETPNGLMVCISFSWRSDLGISIPIDDRSYWPNSKDREWALAMAKQFLQLPQPKIFQNGLFDTYWLRLYGIVVRGYVYDDCYIHHCLDSTDDNHLAYMASVDTREPYYKDEAKDSHDSTRYTRDMDMFWTYNSKDATVQRELFDVYWPRVVERGLEQFYYDNYAAMLQPLLEIMLHGVRMDNAARRRRLAQLTIDCLDIQDKLQALAGYPLHAKKSLSPKRVQKYLYTDLKLPRMISRSTQNVTTNEVALRRLSARLLSRIAAEQEALRLHRYTEKAKEQQRAVADIARWKTGLKAIELLLTHRRKYQLSLFLPEGRTDEDGRMRAAYHFGTETGRLSSSKNPTRTGSSLQNIDREARDLFLPDEGCIFLEVDLSQVEWRIMAMLTHDPKMIELARSRPDEFDIHTYNASLIYGVPLEQVTKEQRDMGKRAVHASSYGAHGTKMSEVLLLAEMSIDPQECQEMIDTYLSHFPAITEWQASIRERIKATRSLTNSWGRTIRYDYERIDDDLFRRGYAFIPQSDAAHLLNQYGLIPLHHFLRKNRLRSRVNTQVHDSLLVSVPPAESYRIASFLVQSLERSHSYGGNELSVPATLKLGTNWKGEYEFKRFPSEVEFNEVAFSLHQKAA
jgi:uracil-DNA glycosylase family 4